MKKGEKKVTLEDGSKITLFEHKWGISAIELAKLESVTPDAIHMRVMRFGNPFQRRNKETFYEKKYGKTVMAIAMELGLHPITVANRENKYGDVYHEPEAFIGKYQRGKQTAPKHWTESRTTRSLATYFKLDDLK